MRVRTAEQKLVNAHNWKHLARWNGEDYHELPTEDTRDVPVRMFRTPRLVGNAEDILCRQIVNATRFQGVKLVVISPDVHHGYGVPVRCAMLTHCVDGSDRYGARGLRHRLQHGQR
jgi:tRNA-splicing ligase RtcB (3'-phosphate/5'-hydroxy nucleic acid ligase)